jgi:hypothetical protein
MSTAADSADTSAVTRYLLANSTVYARADGTAVLERQNGLGNVAYHDLELARETRANLQAVAARTYRQPMRATPREVGKRLRGEPDAV